MAGKKKAVVFGVGKVFKTFMNLYDKNKTEILALFDNNRDLWGTTVCGMPVFSPEKIAGFECDFIIVACACFEDIKKQLKILGEVKASIINFYAIYRRLSLYDDFPMDLLKDEVLFSVAAQKSYEQEMQKIMEIQEKNLFLNAKNYINSVCNKTIDTLEEAEFQVFSQFGEDGIIQWLIHSTEVNEKTFVEFGVEDYTESNTRFLLMNNNWTGLVIDGSKDNIEHVKSWRYFWKYDLTAVAEFITKDNINQLILDAGFRGDIGLLSVDLDGNDYWILNAIECIRPRIVICEYNNIFGAEQKVSVPYDESFVRTQKHYSNLYWGASIGAFCEWAEQNQYYYMGSNSAGNNAFFVRKDCISPEKIPAKNKLFIESKYRESRDMDGKLTYLRGKERLEAIKEMVLVNLSNNCRELIADIYHI